MAHQFLGQSRWSLQQYSRHRDAPLQARIAKMSDKAINNAAAQQEMLVNLKVTRVRYEGSNERLEDQDGDNWMKPTSKATSPDFLHRREDEYNPFKAPLE